MGGPGEAARGAMRPRATLGIAHGSFGFREVHRDMGFGMEWNVAMDMRSCQRRHHGLHAATVTIPSDHTRVGVNVLFQEGWNEDEWRRRPRPKPIGWQVRPELHEQWAEHTQNACDEWKVSCDINDLARVLQAGAHYGSRRWAPSQYNMKSPLQEALTSKMQDITADEHERQTLRHELYKERDRIKRQKKNEWSKGVLKDLRRGGWGN